MKQNNNYIRKDKFDWISILLVFFGIILISLLLYLKSVDKSIKEYELYKSKINKLYQYNQDFNIMFLQSYRSLDNDNIVMKSRLFENIIIYLENSNITKKFGKDVIDTFSLIKSDYMIKSEFIENFKSTNARIIITMVYLYDIRKTIQDNKDITIHTKMIVWEILFKVGQLLFDSTVELGEIKLDISKLKESIDNKYIIIFDRHIKEFFKDSKKINKIIIKNRELNLVGHIDNMNIILDKVYKSYHKTKNIIGISFFIFAFIILLILVKMYLKVRKNREEVYTLAYSDRLTKLPNRRAFEDYLENIMQIEKSNEFFMLFLDIDRFKIVNDSLGHDIGDEILVILGERLLSILKDGDFLAHIGGDEFVTIIESNILFDNIEKFIDDVHTVIRKPINIKEYSLNITSSIGIVKYPTDAQDKRQLLKYADITMYSAKERGGDSYSFYHPELSINIQRRLDLEQELSNALEKKEFILNFQPQYTLDTRVITGAEALIRWNNPILGDVSPEEFIQIAEETGLIVDLGYYIFYEACSAYMDWRKEGVELDLIAINISSVQLSQNDAYERFTSIMNDLKIDPKNIEIELTERYIMEASEENSTIIKDLRALGCRISIDDFGTGYSSMSYLKTLPIDTIKIDKLFILNIPENKHDIAVAKAIIILSQSLGYEVVAEGIENIEQETILKNLSCDKGQGYFFARPMDNETFLEFIKNHK
ncbi:MAG: EAL domain-containing protein [Sulfurovum sp.]